MESLLEFVIKQIVIYPDEVAVATVESEDGEHVTLRLSVHPDDMGVVIGKDGNTARSIRNILKVAALKNQQRVYLDILESGDTEAEPEIAE
jgi:predicted RNA-binding protein YlqC (UPF0109 family)